MATFLTATSIRASLQLSTKTSLLLLPSFPLPPLSDLPLSPSLFSLCEQLLQLLGEIDEAIASLHAWMSPELGIPSLANTGGITCITKEPMGAVLIISAWNYPLYLLLNPLVGAISAGNVACLKPSEYSPATANVTQRLVGKYLDPWCFSVVLGGETETKALLAQRWDKVYINVA
jgi:acyl-CoA reductase-like NAD-dependent aldehyde dehydrogenase